MNVLRRNTSIQNSHAWPRIHGITIPPLIHHHSSLGKDMPRRLLTPNQPIDWYLDWDGTITIKDTLDTLVSIAAQKKPDVDVQTLWKHLGKAYYDDFSALHSEQMKHPPTTLEGEKKFLRVIEAAEIRSVDRVSDSGIFSGLVSADISQGAARALGSNEVQIRPGFSEFLSLISPNGSGETFQGDLAILSVNWSARFIEECLRAARLGPKLQKTRLSIRANELENLGLKVEPFRCAERDDSQINPGGKDGWSETPSTGRIVPGPGMHSRIVFSHDKLEVFSKPEASNTQDKPAPKVYIGDSWTDLECLLAADLGICIRDDPMTSTQQKLADSLQRLGVECRRLQDLLDSSEPETDECSVVWVQDFREVNAWLA